MTLHSKYLRLVVLVLGFGLVWLFYKHNQGPMGARLSENEPEVPRVAGAPKSFEDLPEKDRTALSVLKSIYTASIDVYGKVVDEEGNTVTGAQVEYSLNDKYFKDGTKGQTVSASDGSFRIQGNGASVWLRVQREGYFWMQDKSEGSIPANKATSAASPALFVLKKMGKPASLIYNELITRRIPHDGTPIGLDLRTDRPVDPERAPIQVQVWVIDAKPQQYTDYRWKAELRVPGGGWLVREDELMFEAPEEGYEEVLHVSMPSSDPNERWRSGIGSTDYFIKLGDGTYARGVLHLSTEPERALISLESWWNESGERNLQAGANWFGKAQ
jgi:hypothetical protein